VGLDVWHEWLTLSGNASSTDFEARPRATSEVRRCAGYGSSSTISTAYMYVGLEELETP
jgi:hypothetical protein